MQASSSPMVAASEGEISSGRSGNSDELIGVAGKSQCRTKGGIVGAWASAYQWRLDLGGRARTGGAYFGACRRRFSGLAGGAFRGLLPALFGV